MLMVQEYITKILNFVLNIKQEHSFDYYLPLVPDFFFISFSIILFILSLFISFRSRTRIFLYLMQLNSIITLGLLAYVYYKFQLSLFDEYLNKNSQSIHYFSPTYMPEAGDIIINKKLIAFKIILMVSVFFLFGIPIHRERLMELSYKPIPEKMKELGIDNNITIMYYCFINIIIIIILILISANNLQLIFLLLEMSFLLSGLLINYSSPFDLLRNEQTKKILLKASLSYILINMAGSSILLGGIAYFYGFTGQLNLQYIKEFLKMSPLTNRISHATFANVTLGFLYIIFGFMVKAGLHPFYKWVFEVFNVGIIPFYSQLNVLLFNYFCSALFLFKLQFMFEQTLGVFLILFWICCMSMYNGMIISMQNMFLPFIFNGLYIISFGFMLEVFLMGKACTFPWWFCHAFLLLYSLNLIGCYAILINNPSIICITHISKLPLIEKRLFEWFFLSLVHLPVSTGFMFKFSAYIILICSAPLISVYDVTCYLINFSTCIILFFIFHSAIYDFYDEIHFDELNDEHEKIIDYFIETRMITLRIPPEKSFHLEEAYDRYIKFLYILKYLCLFANISIMVKLFLKYYLKTYV